MPMWQQNYQEVGRICLIIDGDRIPEDWNVGYMRSIHKREVKLSVRTIWTSA